MAEGAAQQRGWRIGSFAGAGIFIDPTIALLAAYVLATTVFDQGIEGLIGASIFLGALFSAVLLHEFGHAAMAQFLRIPSKRIVLTFFGGFVEFAMPPRTRWQSIAVSLAGPAANLATYMALALLINVGSGYSSPLDVYVFGLKQASLLLGGFNLLPGHPLDGGSVLRDALSYFMRTARARQIVGVTGLAIALALTLFAIWLQAWLSLVVALVLALNAWAEIQRAGAALRAEAQRDASTTSNA